MISERAQSQFLTNLGSRVLSYSENPGNEIAISQATKP